MDVTLGKSKTTLTLLMIVNAWDQIKAKFLKFLDVSN